MELINLWKHARQAAKVELTARQKGTETLAGFARYVLPGFVQGPPHETIFAALEDVFHRRCDRLMVLAPPRTGKTVCTSVLLPAFWFGHRGGDQLLAVTHTRDLAKKMGRQVRNLIHDPAYKALFPETYLAGASAAADNFYTNKSGVYYGTSIDAALPGHAADALLMDDLIAGAAAADSPAEREKGWNWFQSSAYTRLQTETSPILLATTRWHDDDVAGRLLLRARENGEIWKIVKIEAIKPDGSSFWPERFPLARLDRIKANVGERTWLAQYMQDPGGTGGTLIKRDKIPIRPPLPHMTPAPVQVPGTWNEVIAQVAAYRAGLRVLRWTPVSVRSWDLAHTSEFGSDDPDWTVGVALDRDQTGALRFSDPKRARLAPHGVKELIRTTTQQDGPNRVQIIPIDPAAGIAWAEELAMTIRGAGGNVIGVPMRAGKMPRANGLIAQIEAGNVEIIDYPGTYAACKAFQDVLVSFPTGTHDDDLDAAATGYNAIMEMPYTAADQRRARAAVAGHMAR